VASLPPLPTVLKSEILDTQHRKLDYLAQTTNPVYSIPSAARVVRVVAPKDNRIKAIIERISGYVSEFGLEFEQQIMSAERSNPVFKFLFDLTSEEATYYRYCVYLKGNVDQINSPLLYPFSLVCALDAEFYISPYCNYKIHNSEELCNTIDKYLHPKKFESVEATVAAAEDHSLSDEEAEELMQLVRAATLDKDSIKIAMEFAISRAAQAEEVIEILVESLSLPETPPLKKLSRLYIISDILFNTSLNLPKVFLYRTGFQKQLPSVFGYLSACHKTLSKGSETSIQFKLLVLDVVSAWKQWSLYEPDLIKQLTL
jgi:U2-associated protein SR140